MWGVNTTYFYIPSMPTVNPMTLGTWRKCVQKITMNGKITRHGQEIVLLERFHCKSWINKIGSLVCVVLLRVKGIFLINPWITSQRFINLDKIMIIMFNIYNIFYSHQIYFIILLHLCLKHNLLFRNNHISNQRMITNTDWVNY